MPNELIQADAASRRGLIQALGDRAHAGTSQVQEMKGCHLFAIHFRDDSTQLGGVRGRQLVNFVFQTLLADGSYLINRYFGCFSRTGYLHSRAPLGMKS